MKRILIATVSSLALLSCEKDDLSCGSPDPPHELPVQVQPDSASDYLKDQCMFEGTYKLFIPDTSGRIYVWNTGDTTSCTVVSEPGTYMVTVYDISSGNTFIQSITLYYCDNAIVPTKFSPDGDGIDDTWQPTFNETCGVEVAVYDPNLKRVFHTENTWDLWDGTYKGKPAPEGVYTFSVKVVSTAGTYTKQTGEFVLTRE